MIYLKAGETRVLILETANLERIGRGQPLKAPDDSILVAWTPDPAWLMERISETDGNAREIARLIDECALRPQQPARDFHETIRKSFRPEPD